MSIEKRPRGVLTHDDRRFLLGDKELTEQSAYNARMRIRDRVRNAILDFRILFNELDNRDRTKIFGPKEDEMGTYELPDGTPIKTTDGMHPPLRWGLVDVMAFLYSATEGSHVRFEHLVEAGVWQAYPKHHPERQLNEVRMTIDSLRRDRVLEHAMEQLERGDVLSPPQVAVLMESEEVSDEQIIEARKLMQKKERKHWLSREKSDVRKRDTATKQADLEESAGEE